MTDAIGFSRRGYQDAERKRGMISRKMALCIEGFEARERENAA